MAESSDPLLTFEDRLVPGDFVDRPNRFVITVRVDESPERVYLADPGALETVLQPGRTVLCFPVDDPARVTGYDAVAVEVDGVYVSVRAAFANDLFEAAVIDGRVPAFDDCRIRDREPTLPEHGRTDFRLERREGPTALVEVKSCTHVDDGVAQFPDRPTERGRRHLSSLMAVAERGEEAHVVFVVQRPDAERFQPYRSVDPEFADRLREAADAGVGLHAFVTAFDPPEYSLVDPDLPIELAP